MKTTIHESQVAIPTGNVSLEGTFGLPGHARGVVVFAHGSGSSRFSPRNRYVAEVLNDAELGTLLFDLLTPEEQKIDAWTGHLRFNIELLGARLVDAVDWAAGSSTAGELPVGLFGASLYHFSRLRAIMAPLSQAATPHARSRP